MLSLGAAVVGCERVRYEEFLLEIKVSLYAPNLVYTQQRRITSGAKGQLSNARRINAHSAKVSFLTGFERSTCSSGGSRGSVSILLRVPAPAERELDIDNDEMMLWAMRTVRT